MSSSGEKLGDLLSSSAIIFVGLLVGKGLALIGEVTIARSLSPAVYGSVALGYTIVLFAGQIAHFGIKDGVTRFISLSENQTEHIEIIQHAVAIVLVTGTITTVLLIGSRTWIGSVMDDPAVATYLVFFVPIALLFPFRGVAMGVLRGEGQSFYAVLARDIVSQVGSITVLGATLIAGIPLIGAFGYWIGVPLFMVLTTIYVLRDDYSARELVRFRPNNDLTRRLWAFSWPLAVSSYIFVFLSYSDILMIGYFLDSAKVGYYRAIQPLRQVSTLLMTALTFLFLPAATSLYEDDDIVGLSEFYRISTKWLTVGTLPIVLVFGLFADDVVRSFFGQNYLPAAPALTILVMGLFFRVFVGLDGDIVKAIDRTKIELGSATVGVVANLALNILLIPRFGIVGAAVGTSAGYIIYNVVEVGAIYYFIGIHPFSMNNVKPLLVTSTSAIVVWHLTRNVIIGLLGLISLGICLTVLAIVSVFFTRSIDNADIKFIEKIEQETGIRLTTIRSHMKKYRL